MLTKYSVLYCVCGLLSNFSIWYLLVL